MKLRAAIVCSVQEIATRTEGGKVWLTSWGYRQNTVEQIIRWAERAKGIKHFEWYEPPHPDYDSDEHEDLEPAQPLPLIDQLAAIGGNE